jgi:thiol:disulfide interchange protein DsbD
MIGLLAVLITAGGGLFTWGSQFQDPLFVLFISTVVFVFALNMFGIFEIQLPSFLQTKASAAAGGSGYAGSFFHGLLATLLATACTAPFMGTALTGTLGQPAYVTLLVFFFLGLGMSAPYLLLAAKPDWLKHIPKPGTWMELAKQFMGFLLMATVIWLLNVFAKITSIEATMWFLAALLGIGMAAWLWGIVRPHYNGLQRVLVSSTAAFMLVLACGLLITKEVTAETSQNRVDPNIQALLQAPTLTTDGEINWRKWSPEAVDAAMETGRPVFIDFTAEWCVNCQTNKRLVLNTEPIEQAFAERNVLALKADWTRKDDEIKAAIHSYDRVGIPLNVVYYPDHPQRPLVLPEILTKGLVLNALEPLGEVSPAPGADTPRVAPADAGPSSPQPEESSAGL